MSESVIGWILAIVIGGVAGWLASNVMKSGSSPVMNVVLGIVGAIIASFLFRLIGISLGGWFGYLISGVVGACILIFIMRVLQK